MQVTIAETGDHAILSVTAKPDSSNCLISNEADDNSESGRPEDATLDIAPLDLLRAFVGVATIRPEPGWKKHAETLISLLLKGSQNLRQSS